MNAFLRNERGIALLYFSAVILPLMFVLCSLTIDIGMYLTEERQVQILLDKANIYAQRFLPFRSDAESAFQLYLSQHEQLANGEITFQYDPALQEHDVMTAKYTRSFRPFFANYFGGNISFPLIVRSDVRATPMDIMLVLDSSHYMAPSITASAGWTKSDGTVDSAAWVFSQKLIRYQHDHDQDGIPTEVPPLVASQQCYSPPFRAQKRSLIELYQYISSFRDNAVGIEVVPSGRPDTLSTRVRSLSSTLLPSQPSDAQFVSLSMPFVTNEHCAAAAERDGAHGAYQFPKPPDVYDGLWRKGKDAPLHMIDQPSGWKYDLQYQPFLSTEDVVWSQVIRPNTTAPANTVAAIDTISEQLLSVGVQQARGGLRHASLKQGIIFAGDTAWAEGQRLVQPDGRRNEFVADELERSLTVLAEQVARYPDIHLRLFYLTFQHQGNAANYDKGVRYLEEIFSTLMNNTDVSVRDRFSLEVFSADNPQQLTQQMTSYLALSRKTGVLSR